MLSRSPDFHANPKPNGKHIKHSKQLSKVVITVATQASVPQPLAAIFL
jgi:hypothetical protein